MKASILNRPFGKALAAWCAFATLATSSAPAWADTAVLPHANLSTRYSNVSGVTGYLQPVYVYDTSSGSEVFSHYVDTKQGTITGNGGNAVLDWNSLSIDSGYTLTFKGGGSFYNVVNSSGGQSRLEGALDGTAANNVYIFNPNGILIGNGANINVSGIFGAFAMGIDSTTLNNWLTDPGSIDGAANIAASGVSSVKVQNGAYIKAAAIELAGKGIDLSGLSSATETFTGPTTLVSGGTLAIDSISGGTVSVKIGEASSSALAGVDLMGKFSDALTVKAESEVKVVGTTVAGGDVTIEAGSVSEAGGVYDGIVTAGKLNVTAKKEGGIQLDSFLGNRVQGEVTMEAAKGDVNFVNAANTTLGNVTAKKVSVTTLGDATVKGKVLATDGDATIVSSGSNLTVIDGGIVAAGSATKNGNVSLMAGNNLSVEAGGWVGAGGDVSLQSVAKSVTVKGTVVAVNDVSATAKTDVTVDASAQVQAVTGDATLTARDGTATIAGTVQATDGDVSVTADTGAALVSGSVTAGGNATIDAGTSATVSGSITASQNATVDAGTSATISGDGSVTATAGDATVTAKNAVTVTGNAVVEAGKAVALKSTVSGDVTIDTAKTVTANDGKVTISANDGKVTVGNTKVTATGADGTIDIDATGDVTVSGVATLDAAKNIEIKTTTGNVTATADTKLNAGGDLDADADAGSIEIKGVATVAVKTDLDAKGSIVANNADNDFQGLVDATAVEGLVKLVDKNSIALNDIDAKTTVDVTAKENIDVVAAGDGIEAGTAITLTADKNITANKKVNAGDVAGDITFTAGESIEANTPIHNENGNIVFNAKNAIAVTDSVRTEKGDINGTAETGDITLGAAGTMWANHGSVTLDAGKSIVSANKGTAITAKDTISVNAKNDIGSSLNVSSPYLKVLSGGSSDVTMKKGVFNKNGDLAVDDVKSSIKTGHDLKLTVEGNLSTPDGGVIRVGNDLDVAVNSATPEIGLTLGGNRIRATDKTQKAIAFKLHGGTQYPRVVGTHTDTAVFIDGRVAGGDSEYFSILQSYEAQAALGMTPDIHGAKMDETPAIFRDKNLNAVDVLPNTWDAKVDDEAVVPEEAKDSDAASKVARR